VVDSGSIYVKRRGLAAKIKRIGKWDIIDKELVKVICEKVYYRTGNKRLLENNMIDAVYKKLIKPKNKYKPSNMFIKKYVMYAIGSNVLGGE